MSVNTVRPRLHGVLGAPRHSARLFDRSAVESTVVRSVMPASSSMEIPVEDRHSGLKPEYLGGVP
jgi:hypothetical protein